MIFKTVKKCRKLLADITVQAEAYVGYFQFDAPDLAEALGGLENKCVLDIGCGLSYPHVIIFQCIGADVVGIDIELLKPNARFRCLMKIAMQHGVRRALRDGVIACVFNPALAQEIKRLMNANKKIPPPDVREGDALNLDFADNSFNLIYSHAVYEHIPDIGRALDEAKRVLAPGGIIRLGIHLYPSLTGGHTGKVGKLGCNVPPWDHLRERTFPPTSYLNELRENDYRKEIESKFDILKWIDCVREQDAELLTEDLERELAAKGYNRKELLTETLVVHARNPV
ncbi:MAG: class I SAM-dependent methyltransferase [Armatimonadota bacterium]|nr:class I SAM-dependent methyltransferase [Armatimonadota bacterium]